MQLVGGNEKLLVEKYCSMSLWEYLKTFKFSFNTPSTLDRMLDAILAEEEDSTQYRWTVPDNYW